MTVYTAQTFFYLKRRLSASMNYIRWKLRCKRSNMRKEAKKVKRKQSSVKCTVQKKNNDQKRKRAEKGEAKEKEEKEREE